MDGMMIAPPTLCLSLSINLEAQQVVEDTAEERQSEEDRVERKAAVDTAEEHKVEDKVEEDRDTGRKAAWVGDGQARHQ